MRDILPRLSFLFPIATSNGAACLLDATVTIVVDSPSFVLPQDAVAIEDLGCTMCRRYNSRKGSVSTGCLSFEDYMLVTTSTDRKVIIPSVRAVALQGRGCARYSLSLSLSLSPSLCFKTSW